MSMSHWGETSHNVLCASGVTENKSLRPAELSCGAHDMAGRHGQPEDDLAWHVSKLFILVMSHLTRDTDEFGEA